MTELTAIDLFSGAGGLTLGLKRAGFDVRAGVDVWPAAVKTYGLNFPHPCLAQSVEELRAIDLLSLTDGRPPDLVAGGPPCQGFSIQRIGPDHDPRNHLVLEFGRLASELAPRYIVMENVPGLQGVRGRPLLQALCALLTGSGYQVRADMVNAGGYGVPQTRRRVIVFAWRRGEQEPRLPEADGTGVTVGDAIADLPRPAPPGTRDSVDRLHIESRLSPLNRERLALIPPGGGFEDLPVHMRVDAHKAGAARIGHRGVYGRLSEDRPAGTITARFDSFTRGRFAHPTQDRNITLREGARLQTFPDSFRFEGTQEEIAALIGNSVPPLMAERIGESVAAAAKGAAAGQDALPLGSDCAPTTGRME